MSGWTKTVQVEELFCWKWDTCLFFIFICYLLKLDDKEKVWTLPFLTFKFEVALILLKDVIANGKSKSYSGWIYIIIALIEFSK